jgi:hypothetical protein
LPGGAKFRSEGAEFLAPVEFYRPAKVFDGAGDELDIVLGLVVCVGGVDLWSLGFNCASRED